MTFDGTGISVFELKRAIIDLNRLGDGTDFDLAIYNEDTNEEYDDDSTVIPRSTSVVARRLPPAKPGRGSAARYVSGKMPVNSLNHSRVERTASNPAVPVKAPDKISGASEMAKAQSEEEKIEAMFKAGAEQWDRQQMEMANATRVYTNAPGKGKAAHVPAHPPPSGYVCYRCGEKGHWIQQCPTNNDPSFDGRPRVKRTTGIPKSFLRAVEKPAMSGDASDGNNPPPQGVRLNAAGEFVIVEPDKASWEQYQVKTKAGAGGTDEPAPKDKELQEKGLECALDHKMFIDPNKTPCCGRTYCSECVTNYLIENDLRCPGCQKDGVLIDDLVPDDETAAKIKVYLAEKQEQKKADATKGDDEKSKEEGESKREAENDAKPTASPQRSPPSEAAARNGSRSPKGASTPKSVSSSTPAPSENGVSRKRPAEDDTQGQRLPQAPRLNEGKRSPPSRPGAQPSQAGQTSQPSGPMQSAATSALPPNMLPGTPPQLFNPALGPMPFPSLGPNGYIGPPTSMTLSATMDPSVMNAFAGLNGFGGMMNGFPNQNVMDFVMPSNGMGPYGNGHNAGGMMPGNGYGNYGSNMPMFVNNHHSDGGQPMGFGVMNGNMSGSANGNGMFPGPELSNGFQPQPGSSYRGPPPDDDADAYFRKPVNPHRHQARQRRVRPSDYREL